MTQRTVELIVKVATELFEWGVRLLSENTKGRRNSNDSPRNTEEK